MAAAGPPTQYEGLAPVGEPRIPRRFNNPFWARILDSVARFFSNFCHTLGALFLRVLSTVVLVAGILGAVVLHIFAFYYMGVLNPNPLISGLIYLPTLAALSLLREEVLKNGTSRSGAGASSDSHAVALAYVMMVASAICSLLHPAWLRAENFISARSMWTSIGATAWLYFAILFSNLAYTASLNIFVSGKEQRMERRYESYGPPPGAAGAVPAMSAAAEDAAAAKDPLAAGEPSRSPYDEEEPTGPYDGAAVDAAKVEVPAKKIETFY